MLPLVSVIVPAYNAEQYIGECLDSLCMQTYVNLEIIVVDDGSTDHTLLICERASLQDERIRIFSQRNQGVSAARNYGLDWAKGKYVVFLDSDDCLHPVFLEKAVARIEEKKSDIVSCEYVKINSDKMSMEVKWLSSQKAEPNWESISGEDSLRLFHMTKDPFLRIVTCKLIRRALIGNQRFEVGVVLGEDTLFMYELIRRGVQFELTDAKWYFYRMHEQSAIHNWNHMKKQNPYAVFIRVRDQEMTDGHPHYARIWQDSYQAILVIKYQAAKKNSQKDVCKNLRKEAHRAMIYHGFSRSRIMYFLIFHCEPLYNICADVVNYLREKRREN